MSTAVYQRLLLRQKAGLIKDIRQQVSVTLGTNIIIGKITGKEVARPIRWKVDFSFKDIISGKTVYAEAKGAETARYKNCLKLWKAGDGPGKLEVWKGSWQDPRLVNVIITERKNHDRP